MTERGLFEKWIVSAAIGFVVRQAAKFGPDTDWAKVKADLATRLADLVPGKWFDDEVVGIANAIVTACERALAQPKTLEIIQGLLAEEKFTEAGKRLREYLLKAWKPEASADAKAKSLIEGYA